MPEKIRKRQQGVTKKFSGRSNNNNMGQIQDKKGDFSKTEEEVINRLIEYFEDIK